MIFNENILFSYKYSCKKYIHEEYIESNKNIF